MNFELSRQSAVNLSLQALTLGSRILLLFALARFLSISEVGVFGILLVTLTLALVLIGIDFHAYNTREILARPDSAPRLLRDQAILHLLTYAVAVPSSVLIFALGVLPWDLLSAFIALMLLEHLAQELQRVLFTLSRPIQAAIVLFLRGGIWIYVLVASFVWIPDSRSIEVVCVAWIAGSAAAVAVSLFFLRDLDWSTIRSAGIDWLWIRQGLRVSLPFLGATLAYRAFLSVDRYSLQHFWGLESVGVYTFYANIRNAIHGFLEAGVLFILRPRVVAAYEQGDVARYRRELLRMLSMAIGLLILLSIAALLTLDPVLRLVGSPGYSEHRNLIWPLLLITAVLALAEIPRTALYAQHKDRPLIASSWISFAAAVVLNLILVPIRGLMGAATATLLAGGITLMILLWLARESFGKLRLPRDPDHTA